MVESVRCGGGHMLLYLSRTKRRRGAMPSAPSSEFKVTMNEVKHSSRIVDSRLEYKQGHISNTVYSASTYAESSVLSVYSGSYDRDPEDR